MIWKGESWWGACVIYFSSLDPVLWKSGWAEILLALFQPFRMSSGQKKKNWNKLPAFENGWREAKVVFIIEAKSRFSCDFACLFRMPSWGVCVLLLACVKCYLAGFQFWWVFIHKPIYSSRKSTVCAATSSK